MRTIFVIFDSLNRRALPCYGGTVVTPNFNRFAERAVVFDNHYVGSLPCMPARRDIHTGRLNFLHRSWGPLEPFDVSYPEELKRHGVYTHLITDHYHYWEDGGATYHSRYSTWEFERGQEWDPYRAVIDTAPLNLTDRYHPLQVDPADARGTRTQGLINREFVKSEDDYSMVACFERIFDFLDRNGAQDNWLVHLECFDPHEPFFAPERFRAHYPTGYNGPILNWPRYDRVHESEQEIAEVRANYAALVTMCDHYFGTLLDYLDEHEMWRDTAVVLTTDHGFMLGEHEWWAKSRMPFYNEVSHIPLLIYHPAYSDHGGERRRALTQTTDIMPTLLDCHGAPIPATVEGHSLLPLLASEADVRTAALFGRFGAATNITDGRYTYFRYPANTDAQQMWEYTLMPTHQRSLYLEEEFEGASLEASFAFMRGFPVLKLPARRTRNAGQGAKLEDTDTVLYDLVRDPDQLDAVDDPAVEARLVAELIRLMAENEAPDEAFTRLGLSAP